MHGFVFFFLSPEDVETDRQTHVIDNDNHAAVFKFNV